MAAKVKQKVPHYRPFYLKGIFVKKMLEKEEQISLSEEKAIVRKALQLGLKAFKAEVKYDED